MRSIAARLVMFVFILAGMCPHEAVADTPKMNDVVFKDQFSSLPTGQLQKVLWARAEYHYMPEGGPKGPWTIATYSSTIGSQRAWKVIVNDGKKGLLQSYTPESDKHAHPMVVAGDAEWNDYLMLVRFKPMTDKGRSGVVFRYQNNLCNYFVGLEGQHAVLKMVKHETAFRTPYEEVLAKKPFKWKPNDDFFMMKVVAEGSSLSVSIDETPLFTVNNSTYAKGKIGLTSDTPTLFDFVEVRMAFTEPYRKAIREREQEEAVLQSKLPAMKLWKRIDFKDFGVGRNLRFGDLDNDGQIDVLSGQMEHHGPKDSNSELSCLTAITFDGKVLWKIGEADSWKDHLTNDVAFQIHDLDGDGKTEVIYCKNQELIVADGATGETKHKVPTPLAIPGPKNVPKYPRILGDSLFLANLGGTGRADHLVLKDRYTNFWVMSPKLETIWHGTCQTGHYPFVKDLDGDGRDELFVGYSLFEPDGSKRWSLDTKVKDHADAVAVVDLHPEAPTEPKVLVAASDEGFFVADLKGDIQKHYHVGHVQNLTVANLRDDLPGLEVVTMNYWGNQGITRLYNAEIDNYHEFEPCNHGSPILPVNWSGGSEEFFVVSANVEHGGFFDGHGRRVMKFPADGHPDMCYMVLDVTGDARDELIVWDPFELWVYTQSDSPRTDRVYKPTRTPLHNLSNYQSSVSLPGWSTDVKK